MNQRTVISLILACAVACVFLFLATILPRTTTAHFASPDETAVSLFAKAWTWKGGFRLSTQLPDAVQNLAFLHPRSIVRQGDWLVPVGFLGMPFVSMLFERLHDGVGSFVTPFFVLLSAIALWTLVLPFGKRIAWSASAIYLFFPTVLLYSNRGLFPNLPVVALTLCAMALLQYGLRQTISSRKILASCLAGLAIGLAFFIRPTEMIWALPWIAWIVGCGKKRDSRLETRELRPEKRSASRLSPLASRLSFFVIAFLFVSGIGAVASMRTYPFHARIQDQPVIGYLLRDRVSTDVSDATIASVSPVKQESASLSRYLPFGIHPRAMLRNIKTYLFGSFALWVGVALFGFAILWKEKRKGIFSFSFLTAWTLGSLLLLYGQSEYADNINGTVTIGNSFLRYLLPLAPILALGCAMMADKLVVLKRGKVLSMCLVVFLCVSGAYTALAKDEEGVLQTRQELLRYDQIASAFSASGISEGVVLSERSDKIFASQIAVVSPLPGLEDLKKLASSGSPVYFFHRISTTGGSIPMNVSEAFEGDWVFVFAVGNESLFRIDQTLEVE